MPNIQTKNFKHPKYPFEKDGFIFEYATLFEKNRSLIKVKAREIDKEFFIEVIKRESDYLIKAEKLSRFSPIFFIQKALKALVKKLDLQLTYSNIESKKSTIHFNKSDQYIKPIEYFIKDFLPDTPIVIEIGFGSGRHLLYKAQQNPNTTFIGLEIHKPSIEQVIKQCKIQNINNVLIVDYDARIFLELLQSQSVKTIYLHFPVPWDKKPHRRVISDEFIKECLRVLIKDGTFELRTDSENYYNYTFEVINHLNKFDIKIRKNHKLQISSKYEDRWKRLEKNIYDIILTNTHPLLLQKKIYEIKFEDSIFDTFKNLNKNFSNVYLKDKNCFVHFENIFPINDYEGVVKLTLGSYNKSEHKYIVFKDKKVKYFPNYLLPIKDNYKAHQLLIEYLKGISK